MRFSRDWLAEYVELPESLEELSDALTAGGLTVEYTTPVGGDVVLDLEVTPNRPDCMNHLGLAREVSVLCGGALTAPRVDLDEIDAEVDDAASVEVVDPALCPRYAARVVEGVEVGPSPQWMQDRLEAIGVRPINNVVDVTNYVLWETGQPLHAFDLDRLAGSAIVVRRAAAGEQLVSLDGESRRLTADDLVIADRDRAVAVAGVMGGRDSEVVPQTRRVLLESAHFDRTSVRLTAKRLGLHTDASHRFERGADPAGCVKAVDRAAALLAQTGAGGVRRGTIDVLDPSVLERRSVVVSPSRLDAFAGAHIDPDALAGWLAGLGFEVDRSDDEAWSVLVPTWRRFDVERREDVYEEAIRVFGFDRIDSALPVSTGSDGPETVVQKRRRRLRQHLVGQGFAEAIHYSFISEEEDAGFPVLAGEGAPVALANPLSERYSILRRSIAPGLAEGARFNQRRGAASVRLFEIGHIFGERESEAVALVTGGPRGLPWDGVASSDLFDLKGVVDSVLEVFQVQLEVRAAELAGMRAGTGAELVDGEGRVVGWFAQWEDDGPFPLYLSELLCEALGSGGEASTVRVPSRFPGVSADLTLTHAAAVSWAELAATVRSAASAELVGFRLKDRYRGEGVPEGAVNTTIAFDYNAPDRSLSQEEVNERQSAVTRALQEHHGWPG
jgi:phenylalanyl-tRNA synthetase beta chain